MLLLIPHLFPTKQLLKAAAPDLRLPALQSLLARGTRQPCPDEGVEAALCEELGIARQQDWPLAPITLAADGGVAGDAYWLRADPVHLQVMRDRIVLADNDAIDTVAPGSRRACRQHRRAFWNRPAARCPCIRNAGTCDLPSRRTWPPRRCRLRWGAISIRCCRKATTPCGFGPQLNELQMLLHDHPVNQAREARGELPVNSLWLWGGGRQPSTRTQPPCRFIRSNAEAQALGAFCSARVHPLPARLDVQLLETDGIILLDALTRTGQYRRRLRLARSDASTGTGLVRAAAGNAEQDWPARPASDRPGQRQGTRTCIHATPGKSGDARAA